MVQRFLVIAIAGLTAASPAAAQTAASQDSIVYAIALDSLLAGTSRKPFVVKSVAKPGFAGLAVSRGRDNFSATPMLDSATIDDFKRATNAGGRIPAIGSRRVAIIMVDDSTFDSAVMIDSIGRPMPRVPPDVYWARVKQRFGEEACVVSMTPIGYNKERDQALLVVEYGCGPMWGRGYNIILRKSEGMWRITKIARTWIS